jgi:hypothetical protein
MDWKEPTEDEIRAAHDSSDLPIIAIIKGLSSEDRKLIYNSLSVKEDHKEDFMKTQEPWIRDFKHYWRQNHCDEDPDSNPQEFSADYLKSCENERFRLYYAAKYPDRVRIEHPENTRALEFMLETCNAVEISKLISALPVHKQ